MHRRYVLSVAVAAVVIAASVAGFSYFHGGPSGTIELIGASHGQVPENVTRVTLHSSDGDTNISPNSQVLAAAPKDTDYGPFSIPARNYSAIDVQSGSQTLHAAVDFTVATAGITPLLIAVDHNKLSVYTGNDHVNLGLQLLGGQLTALPDVPFTDQNGKTVHLSDTTGKITIVASFLTHCHDACPLYTAVLGDLTKVLQARGWTNRVNLVMVTMDPGRDTPAVLKAFVQKTGATWELLTTTDDAALQLFWASQHATYQDVPWGTTPPIDWYTGKPETYEVLHSSLAVVLDSNGYPRFTLVGDPHLGHNLSPPLASLLLPGNTAEQAGNQLGWSVQDVLDRIDILLGLPTEGSGELSTAVQVGKSAPGFTLSDLNGHKVSLADELGHPVVVNFWATWCDPCKRELPLLNKSAGSKGLVVLALDEGENAGAIQPFLNSVLGTQQRITPLLDPDTNVGGNYLVRGLPVSVFIDAGGVARVVHVGELDQTTLTQSLATIGAG
jgi:cytochrome oxidase Cu insertion factor (SCO1/SenC/PrrC family)